MSGERKTKEDPEMELAQLLSDATDLLHADIDQKKAVGSLKKVLDTGRMFSFVRDEILSKMLRTPSQLSPKKDDACLIFWNWSWGSSSGKKVLPIDVQMGKFLGETTQVGAGIAQRLLAVNIGKIDYEETVLKPDKNHALYDQTVYPDSPVILPLKKKE